VWPTASASDQQFAESLTISSPSIMFRQVSRVSRRRKQPATRPINVSKDSTHRPCTTVARAATASFSVFTNDHDAGGRTSAATTPSITLTSDYALTPHELQLPWKTADESRLTPDRSFAKLARDIYSVCMSPRNSVAESRRTRERILDRSVAVASVEGLEGLTLGGLATDLGMSKAGVIGPFGNKESLQLATLDRGYALFSRIALEPVADMAHGAARLRLLVEGWLQYLVNEPETFPGGCLFTTAAVEFDGRPGPVRDAIGRLFSEMVKELTEDVRAAVGAGDVPASTDPEQAIFELLGIFSSVNLAVQLFGDPAAGKRARRSLARILGDVT